MLLSRVRQQEIVHQRKHGVSALLCPGDCRGASCLAFWAWEVYGAHWKLFFSNVSVDLYRKKDLTFQALVYNLHHQKVT